MRAFFEECRDEVKALAGTGWGSRRAAGGLLLPGRRSWGLPVAEVGVEGGLGRVVDVGAGPGQGQGGSVEAVHARVLPLNRDGAGIADLVEGAEVALQVGVSCCRTF